MSNRWKLPSHMAHLAARRHTCWEQGKSSSSRRKVIRIMMARCMHARAQFARQDDRCASPTEDLWSVGRVLCIDILDQDGCSHYVA